MIHYPTTPPTMGGWEELEENTGDFWVNQDLCGVLVHFCATKLTPCLSRNVISHTRLEFGVVMCRWPCKYSCFIWLNTCYLPLHMLFAGRPAIYPLHTWYLPVDLLFVRRPAICPYTCMLFAPTPAICPYTCYLLVHLLFARTPAICMYTCWSRSWSYPQQGCQKPSWWTQAWYSWKKTPGRPSP